MVVSSATIIANRWLTDMEGQGAAQVAAVSQTLAASSGRSGAWLQDGLSYVRLGFTQLRLPDYFEEHKMNNLLVLSVLLAVAMNVFASPDSACRENCARQGYSWEHCATACRQHDRRGNPQLLDQPGLPRNPAFEQMQRDARPAERPLPPVVDNRCVSDCRAKGYNYQLCRRQCSY